MKYNIDEIYQRYYSLVNMSYSELLSWSKTACSRKSSLTREPIQRNLLILSLNKSDWSQSTCKKALKTISYLSRAKEIKSSKIISECGYTKNEIALKNWAYDIKN
jgi:hypothetical protein